MSLFLRKSACFPALSVCLLLSVSLMAQTTATTNSSAPKKPVHHRKHGRTTAAAHAATAHSVATHAGTSHQATAHAAAEHPVSTRAGAVRTKAATKTPVRKADVHRAHRYVGRRYTTSSFLAVQGVGDATAGEDARVREAAIEALGNIHGTAVVIDASTGRILAMVNQSIALAPGAEPCSTIKLTVGMAALSEGLITRDTMVNLGGFRMNLTQALAHSNNLYFEEVGRELGFARVHHYARLFGLGELAGYKIPGEQLGEYPEREIPASEGGVGRMCSFGQGVSLTPLQLGAYVAAIANDGTLYYLQHPTTQQEIADFHPRIKRVLPIRRFIPDMQDGMAGSVEYGTARSLRLSFRELPVFGKTGTCSNLGTRFGWFASYSDTPRGTMATVFLLEGGRDLYGPLAAGLTGKFYQALWESHYFDDSAPLEATNAAPQTAQAGH